MHDAKELKIAYIGGGSRGWAWGFMTDLATDPDLCGTVRLYDIDREAAERNRIIGGKISAHPKALSRWSYEVSSTLEEALTGVDFVVISILPATFREMQSDVHLPERVGIWQPVGDTVGAGGFMRAMRTIPMFVTIGQAIRDFAPDAWVINYTNPMSLCVRTLYEVFPEIHAFDPEAPLQHAGDPGRHPRRPPAGSAHRCHRHQSFHLDHLRLLRKHGSDAPVRLLRRKVC